MLHVRWLYFEDWTFKVYSVQLGGQDVHELKGSRDLVGRVLMAVISARSRGYNDSLAY